MYGRLQCNAFLLEGKNAFLLDCIDRKLYWLVLFKAQPIWDLNHPYELVNKFAHSPVFVGEEYEEIVLPLLVARLVTWPAQLHL